MFAREISSLANDKDFKKVLLIDDLSDTGLTLNKSIEWLKSYGPTKNFIKEIESNKIYIPIDDYKNFLSTINKKLVKSINKVWGSPEKDKDFIDGKFLLKAFHYKNCLIALQPERGDIIDREHQYHDLDSVPKHSYVAFYFWIKHKFKTDVIFF